MSVLVLSSIFCVSSVKVDAEKITCNDTFSVYMSTQYISFSGDLEIPKTFLR